MLENEEVKSTEQNNKISKNELINALKTDFATSVKRIYINSLKKEVGFREITVNEQKTLSRIILDNGDRKDIVYDAQCSIINTACLDDKFDIYSLTEFDRIKLLIALYQANMFKNDIQFKCKKCGCENAYKLDFKEVLEKLDDIDIEDKNNFIYENDNWIYKFKVAYPNVARVSSFYKNNNKKYKGVTKKEAKTLDNLTNIDYINLFIKEISIENKVTNNLRNINLNDYKVDEIEDIISIFPQDVLYTEEGILQYIAENFVKKINDTFEVHKCMQCGEIAEPSAQVGGMESFL